MRTNLQLLKIVKIRVSKEADICSGLCTQADDLVYEYLITKDESKKFLRYLNGHKPKDYKEYLPWYFKQFDKRVRLEWLNYHINQLSVKKKETKNEY